MKRNLRKKLRAQLERHVAGVVEGWVETAHCNGHQAELVVRAELIRLADQMGHTAKRRWFWQ